MHKFVLVSVVVSLSMLLSDYVSATSSNKDDTQAPVVICKLPPVKGVCRALFFRWRYNPEAKNCEKFMYGGCQGNANNFRTQKACMDVCAGVE